MKKSRVIGLFGALALTPMLAGAQESAGHQVTYAK
ncbi:MAG: hypothetical protein ACI95C_000735, partial [Pseudohongiellaceae bacterium]